MATKEEQRQLESLIVRILNFQTLISQDLALWAIVENGCIISRLANAKLGGTPKWEKGAFPVVFLYLRMENGGIC